MGKRIKAARADAVVEKHESAQAYVPVHLKHLYPLLLQTVRYAMGRMTYAVGEACEMVRTYGGRLTKDERAVILRDIQEELNRATSRWGYLGMECDHKEWVLLTVWLRHSIGADLEDQ